MSTFYAEYPVPLGGGGGPVIVSYVDFKEGSAPAAPASGYVREFAGTNGALYRELSTGQIIQQASQLYTNAFDYGADPTGSTDSTTAIQTALNAEGGPVFLPQGTYLISSTLTIPSDCSGLIGVGNNTNLGSTLQWGGSTNTTMVAFSGTTARYGVLFRDFCFNSNNTNGVTCLDITYMAQGGRVDRCRFQQSGNSTIGIYAIGNVGGASPYYSEIFQCDFEGSATVSSNGSVGILFDRLLISNAYQGPNANRIYGGRFSGVDVGIWIKGGQDNVLYSPDLEDIQIDGIRIGVSGADSITTATGGTIQTIVVSGAGWASNQWVGGVVQDVTSGEYGYIVSNTSTTITIQNYFQTVPTSGDAINLWYPSGQYTRIFASRQEGYPSANPNHITLEPGQINTFIDSTSTTGLGNGKVVNAVICNTLDKWQAGTWQAPFPLFFSITSVPSNTTGIKLYVNNFYTELLLQYQWQVVAMSVQLDQVITAGKATLYVLDNGTKINSGGDLFLTSTNTTGPGDVAAATAQTYVPGQIMNAGNNRTLALQLDTNSSFATASSANMQVCLMIQLMS